MTAGSEGGLFIWDTPPDVLRAKADSDMPDRPPTEEMKELNKSNT